MNRILLSVACLAVTSYAGAVQADENEQYQEVRKLLSEGKIAAAEEAFEAAIKESPDSLRLKGLYYTLYYYNNRDGNYGKAIEHMQSHIQQNLMPSKVRPQGNLTSLSRYVDLLVTAYDNAGKLKEAGEQLDQLAMQLESVVQDDPENPFAQYAVRELQNRKLVLLAQTGQQDQARTILATRLAAAEKAVEDQPADEKALLDLVFLLKGNYQLAEETDSDDAGDKQQEFLERLMTLAKANPDNAPLVLDALNEHYSAILGMARKQPYRAEKLLETLKEFAESIESEDRLVKGRATSMSRSIPSFERAIAAGKYHAELIGKEAFPLTAEAWVNGDPLTDADLKGKVVLLDFWAVWCGPCIATFPHLREWQEKYEDKGLVIIGVTNYYNYGWDEENHRPRRQPKEEDELTPEEEQAAMLKFAEHYELKHRFMITPKDASFKQDYGVSGIPQAVLIDREGKIRLIRVGSGDANAEDLDKMLAELIGNGS